MVSEKRLTRISVDGVYVKVTGHETVRVMMLLFSPLAGLITRLNYLSAMAKIGSVPVRVLRDTGCTTVGVRKSLVPHDSYTQELIKCVTFGGHIQTFPVTEIDI
ncbi:hypothetical protein BaRGS_00016364 [Batillaria attramentaria]|uniref:Uncharacterized protein n=1 Tax=Batillaria attramentaria TaxID=370345 RepID=A0ABD0KZ38_9CAEN